jgi:uncharacterized protein (TIGR02266 family)
VRRVDLELADKAEWVKIFDPRDSTLFVGTNNPAAIGETIRIDLVVGKGGPKVILRGKVIARRVKGDASLPTGITLALGNEEREKVNYLNGFVRGGMLNLREKRRLPIRLKCTYGGIKGPCESYTRDINEEGVFIISEDPLPEGSELHFMLTVPGRSEPVQVSGTVQHTVVVEDEDIPGMGIRLIFKQMTSEEFKEIVDQLEQAFLIGRLPEECLI